MAEQIDVELKLSIHHRSVLDKICVMNPKANKSHITLEDMLIRKDLGGEQKYKSSVERYWRSINQKNYIKCEDMVRGRSLGNQQKYPEHIVRYGDVHNLVLNKK